MARRRSTFDEVERDLYLYRRTRRDIRTYQRGGLGALLIKLLKRRTRRTVARKSGGWL